MQDFYWRDFIPGYIPYDAMEYNGRYIGQVIVDRFAIPAMIFPHLTLAAVAVYDKVEYIKENMKILCSPNPSKFYWEHVDFGMVNDTQMKNVVKGGYQDSENIFIGRAKHELEYKIGKVFDINHSCLKGLWIWNKDNERINLYKFELLKYDPTLPLTKHHVKQ